MAENRLREILPGLLDEKRMLAVKETLTDEERARLRELDERLRGLVFGEGDGLPAPMLTKEQQEREKQLVREILGRSEKEGERDEKGL